MIIGLLVVAAIILGKLFYIQIIDDKYKINASNNSMVYDIIYPTRGIIYDRNGKIIVSNKVTYDILVTPREVKRFDTLMLANTLNVSPEFIRDKMAEYARNRRRIGYQSVVMTRTTSRSIPGNIVPETTPGRQASRRPAKRNSEARKATISTCATPVTRSNSVTRTERWTRRPSRDTTSTRRSTRISSSTVRI